MKRIVILAVFGLAACTNLEWTGVQSKFADDMDLCQSGLRTRMHKKDDEDVVRKAYVENQVPNGDAIKKSFQNCMMSKGWNVKGEKEKKAD